MEERRVGSRVHFESLTQGMVRFSLRIPVGDEDDMDLYVIGRNAQGGTIAKVCFRGDPVWALYFYEVEGDYDEWIQLILGLVPEEITKFDIVAGNMHDERVLHTQLYGYLIREGDTWRYHESTEPVDVGELEEYINNTKTYDLVGQLISEEVVRGSQGLERILRTSINNKVLQIAIKAPGSPDVGYDLHVTCRNAAGDTVSILVANLYCTSQCDFEQLIELSLKSIPREIARFDVLLGTHAGISTLYGCLFREGDVLRYQDSAKPVPIGNVSEYIGKIVTDEEARRLLG